MKKQLLILTIAFPLAACTNMPDGSPLKMESITKALTNSVQFKTGGTSPTPYTREGVRLADTELNGIFTKSTSKTWPRVAINVDKVPKWFYGSHAYYSDHLHSPTDCIKVSITLWKSETSSKKFENMDFCGDEIIPDTPFADVNLIMYQVFPRSGTTGDDRTTGPTPPAKLFPMFPGSEMFFSSFGKYYLGSILHTMGYNWRGRIDQRLWVINVPTYAQVQAGMM